MDGLSGQQRPDRSSEHQQRETWSHDRSVHSVHDSSLTSPTVQDRLQYDRKELCLVQRDVNGTHLSGCALARQNARARDKRRDERGRWGGEEAHRGGNTASDRSDLYMPNIIAGGCSYVHVSSHAARHLIAVHSISVWLWYFISHIQLETSRLKPSSSKYLMVVECL